MLKYTVGFYLHRAQDRDKQLWSCIYRWSCCFLMSQL